MLQPLKCKREINACFFIKNKCDWTFSSHQCITSVSFIYFTNSFYQCFFLLFSQKIPSGYFLWSVVSRHNSFLAVFSVSELLVYFLFKIQRRLRPNENFGTQSQLDAFMLSLFKDKFFKHHIMYNLSTKSSTYLHAV